jgi:hypothetical protein
MPGQTPFTRNVLARVVGCQDLDEAAHARLARRVRVEPRGESVAPGRRGDADDRAATGPQQRADPVLGGQERAGEVDVERPPPGGEIERLGGRVAPGELRRRVGHDDVQAAPQLGGGGDGQRDGGLVGHVRDEWQQALVPGGERGGVDVERGDAGALGREAVRDGASDPLRGAGHERATPGEAVAHRGRTRTTARTRPTASHPPTR